MRETIRVSRPDLAMIARDVAGERRTLPVPHLSGGRNVFAGWGPKI